MSAHKILALVVVLGACDDGEPIVDDGDPVGTWQWADIIGEGDCLPSGTIRPWELVVAPDLTITGAYPSVEIEVAAACSRGLCALAGTFTWADVTGTAVQTFELDADEAGAITGGGAITATTFYNDEAPSTCSQIYTSKGRKS